MTSPASRYPFSPSEIADALVDSADRFADLIPLINDPSVDSPYVDGWAVDEIVRHVAYGPFLYGQIADQERELVASAGELGAFSDVNIDSIRDLTLADCEARIRTDYAGFSDRVREASLDDPTVPFFAGSETNLVGLGGVLVGECEVHGMDVAAAIGQTWQIPRDHAAMTVLAATNSAGPAWVDVESAAGHSGSYEVRLRGGLGLLRMRFDEGELSTDPADPWKPDVIISADPAAFLRVFYGRQNQWSAIFRGQMLAWGTRPWNAFSLVDKFQPI
jgi:uncharacterized protein (TIGR03083 family)